ncbi:MAG: hypothetical protein O7G87_11015 [bacterium]|nr:hypothetical protein [bacterium]
MDTLKIDLQGAKILLVDDTEANLNLLCELLEPEGYKISMAPTVKSPSELCIVSSPTSSCWMCKCPATSA